MQQHKGRALGGPLNGTMIEAGGGWNGRIEKDLTGLYRWDPLKSTWAWETRDQPLTRRTGRPYRTKTVKSDG